MFGLIKWVFKTFLPFPPRYYAAALAFIVTVQMLPEYVKRIPLPIFQVRV